ncbi:hypothetical protein WCLP8_2410010 [uncultured Gammaproteobacteria bacterium]
MQRHLLRRTQQGKLAHPHFDPAGRQLVVGCFWATFDHLAGNRDHRFQLERVQLAEQRAGRIEHALGQPIMVAQIDEQQAAVVAFTVHPAGQADGLASMVGAQRAAGMGAVGVHGLGNPGGEKGRVGSAHDYLPGVLSSWNKAPEL